MVIWGFVDSVICISGFGYFLKDGKSRILPGRIVGHLIFYKNFLERVHIFQVKTSLKFFDNSEKKIRTQGQLLLIAS